MGAARLTGAGLALIAVCYGLARFGYGLFVPEFRASFGLDSTVLGAVAAGSYVGYCLAIMVTAGAVGRFGPRRVATAAGSIAAAGMALVAAAPNIWTLAVGVLVAGASTGVASPPIADAVATAVRGPASDRAQAIVNAGPGAGIAVSGAVALLAIGHWRLAWAGFCAIAVAVAFWIAYAVPPAPFRSSPAESPWSGLRVVVLGGQARRFVAGALLFGVSSAAVWIFGRDHVTAASHLNPTASVLLWTTLGVAELTGLAAGDLAARFGLSRLWVVALLAVAATSATLGYFPNQATVAFLSVALFGASYVVLTTVVFFWATRTYPQHVAAAVSVGFLAIAAGQALASPLVGALADHTGPASAFLICTALATLAAIALRPEAAVAVDNRVRANQATKVDDTQ